MTLHDTAVLVAAAFVVFATGFLLGYMLRSIVAYLRNERA